MTGHAPEVGKPTGRGWIDGCEAVAAPPGREEPPDDIEESIDDEPISDRADRRDRCREPVSLAGSGPGPAGRGGRSGPGGRPGGRGRRDLPVDQRRLQPPAP